MTEVRRSQVRRAIADRAAAASVLLACALCGNSQAAFELSELYRNFHVIMIRSDAMPDLQIRKLAPFIAMSLNRPPAAANQLDFCPPLREATTAMFCPRKVAVTDCRSTW